MSIRDELVYGERIGDVLPGLRAFVDAGSVDDDGTFHSSVRLDPEIGDPLFRALMRAEAELLLEDADSVGSPWDARRTDPQRAADALVRLAETIGNEDEWDRRRARPPRLFILPPDERSR